MIWGLKEYCNKEIDAGEDKLKVVQQLARDADTAIKDAKGAIQTLESEIAGLVGGLALLDKAVSEATAQRKKVAISLFGFFALWLRP